MKEILVQYKTELQNELNDILSFWQAKTIDNENNGFYGKIDFDNVIIAKAPKGSVLNSRILWSFSAAFNLTENKSFLQTADRAFKYITEHFIDDEYGGVYWTVDYKGNSLDTKKQIYALAFAIYGLSEYYISSKNEEAKNLAIELYLISVKYSYDKKNGGYIEALSRDWKEMADVRLSNKDANEKKTMNTHLHLLEGFANLYRVWPNEKLEERISELICLFPDHITDPVNHHLKLFFDEKWENKINIISYGHDIEASWLIGSATQIINNKELGKTIGNWSVLIVNAAMDGLDNDGGLWYEYDITSDNLVKEKHWWTQAEAMTGFFNAWESTGNKSYLSQSLKSWHFVKNNILDKKNGEWFWGVAENTGTMKEDKAGIWKCPYHNSRACIEIIKRIDKLIE